ncbi:putative phage tail protein [Lysinibacillus sphaericus]|uniref:putative phage tail protein n=1 Tax=Lysinibacillus sphaericus TaxID=1421 RepID=UPI003CFC1DB0
MILTHKRLINHLPKYERSNTLIVDILKSVAIELGKLDVKSEVNYTELFIDTAIKALLIHERDLGISKSLISNQQRRELIIAHYRATLEQTTDETIKNVASAFSNGDVEINETDNEGVYEIKFIGTIGIPDNMQGLMNTLDIIIPAHIDVIYTYLFNVWGDISHKTWGGLEIYTWEELSTKEVI